MNRVRNKVTIASGGTLGISPSAALLLTGEGASAKHTIPSMQQAGGSITNMLPAYVLMDAADIPPCHAFKGALRLKTKNDSRLYARDNLLVYSIHRGFICPPLVKESGKRPPVNIATFYGFFYLAIIESKFVSGSELVIDGGYTALHNIRTNHAT